MFEHQGIWLPDGEKHFPEWMTKNGEIVDGKGTYQINKLRAALKHCKQFRVAVDVGGHVGLWAMQLAKSFQFVHVFEPVGAFRDCLYENMARVPNWDSYSFALGATAGRVSMTTPTLDGGLDTGGTHVGGEGDIEMRTLDSLEFSGVDFLKIDCEGYEHHVIAGARETLLRCKPCVIVEQKPHKLGPNFGIKGTPAVDALKALGAEVRREISGDYIMAWR
jgi:FkbM family methyltransferase